MLSYSQIVYCLYIEAMKSYNTLAASALILCLFTASLNIDAKTADVASAPAKAVDQYELALKYASGDGVPRDDSIAIDWYLKSAGQGFAPAQFNLGYIFLHGVGTETNAPEALKWFGAAAEQGLPVAQFNLGVMYKLGDGVPKNLDKAFRWTLAAAEQGHADAQFNLGVWYGRGEGIEEDQRSAFKWYLKSAKQGNENAKVIVGGRYHDGSGVDRDPVIGHAWLFLGKTELSKTYLDFYIKHSNMTPLQIIKGEALAKHCHDSGYRSCEIYSNFDLL